MDFFAFVFGTVFRAFGFGVKLLDYRPLGDGIYDATRWFTVFFFPVVPLTTLRIRPKTAQATNLGAVVETRYDFDLLGERPTPGERIIRMYLFAWLLVPSLAFGPVVFVIMSLRRGGPSTLGIYALVAAAIWMTVVFGLLNRRHEKPYENTP